MKKNKNLMLIGAAILIYFLLPKNKTTSAGSGENTNNSQPDNQLMRFKNTKSSLNTIRRKQSEINGVVF